MSHVDPQTIERALRREQLFTDSAAHRVAWGPDVVERLIPHRPPMRLVDGIDAVDLAGLHIEAHHLATTTAPWMHGHFPGDPMLPGVLQAEMIGQAGLCLWSLAEAGVVDPTIEGPESPARVIRIHGASYLAPIQPGDRVRIAATQVVRDAIAGIVAGQVSVAGRICSTCVLEVYFG
jgi:3-hydroxymyristoyl/3-hydroxydecanoyl-(acyl carrier protein) dehydratase